MYMVSFSLSFSDETKILKLLPKNMKAEIALNIHVETLAKVKLFQNCETAFLRDLVVKLRSIIILPGDFVCRKVSKWRMNMENRILGTEKNFK